MSIPFLNFSTGRDAGDAFLRAAYADMAAYPPTGIGQKAGYRQLQPPAGETAHEMAERLLQDPQFNAVAAPAACVAVGDGQFLFFGRARRN